MLREDVRRKRENLNRIISKHRSEEVGVLFRERSLRRRTRSKTHELSRCRKETKATWKGRELAICCYGNQGGPWESRRWWYKAGRTEGEQSSRRCTTWG